jgi:integrase
MGISYREGRKLPWMVYWRDKETGLQKSRSFADQDEALSFHEWAKGVNKRKKEKPTSIKISVDRLLAEYIDNLKSTEEALKQTKYHAQNLKNSFGRRCYTAVTEKILREYMRHESKRGMSQLTINRRISILRSAYSWGLASGLIKSIPFTDLKLPGGKCKRFAPPSIREISVLLKVASPHVFRVILLGVYVGARIGPSELFRVTWSDVDLENQIIRIWSAEKNPLKPWRDVPIRQSLIPMMEQWLAEDRKKDIEYVIHWAGKPVKSIFRAWHTALDTAGISRRLRPYDLRHAFATYALEGGADIKALADLMGHRDPTMILRTYQHVQESQKRKAVEAAPELLAIKPKKGRTGRLTAT